MKRSMYFAVFAFIVAIIAGIIVYFNGYFYPEKYVKNDEGEYVNVTVEAKTDPFPIDKSTGFIIEHYYADENRTLSEQVDSIPNLLGCNKDDVIAYLKDYMDRIPQEEKEKGLVSYQMVSYKDQTITLRKTYKKQEFTGYYAKSFNGTVVILNGDEKTVFEYTQIGVETLPEEMQEQITAGIYLENDEALYGFLENYSS